MLEKSGWGKFGVGIANQWRALFSNSVMGPGYSYPKTLQTARMAVEKPLPTLSAIRITIRTTDLPRMGDFGVRTADYIRHSLGLSNFGIPLQKQLLYEE